MNSVAYPGKRGVFSSADHDFMARALRQAERGLFSTMPNPRVGCVIVRDGRVLGEGFTQPAGCNHAEIQALEQARAKGEDVRGATVYVTLEPCSHYGRTPPCAGALVNAGVGRVVSAMRDPNPLVAGQGIAMLELAGIPCVTGLLETQARELNAGFVSRMTLGRPWVRVKIAASLDGKTALNNGKSQWITGPAARMDVQRLRGRSCAMLTGIGTVLADDPRLTVRELQTPRQPLRVVVDSRLRTPPHAAIAAGGNTLVATLAGADATGMAALRRQGVEVAELPEHDGRVDLAALLALLGRREINEVTVEAGAGLNGALLRAGLVDEIVLYLAPVLMGDKGRGLFDLPELSDMNAKRPLRIVDTRFVGDVLRLVAKPA